MFLVELRPGKEELYQSADDLAAAISRAEVDAQARIYHTAAAKWVPITAHPVYRRVAPQ
jgi:hypothetical protein